jgi:hypothetical protein
MIRRCRRDTTLDERRHDDPGLDEPARRAAAQKPATPATSAITWHSCAGSAASRKPRSPSP